MSARLRHWRDSTWLLGSPPLSLEDASNGEDSISANPGYVSAAFKETFDYWRGWVRRSNYRGRRREIVNRSALV